MFPTKELLELLPDLIKGRIEKYVAEFIKGLIVWYLVGFVCFNIELRENLHD
jgi:hypothetical protein